MHVTSVLAEVVIAGCLETSEHTMSETLRTLNQI